ncbi:hypothetical protein MOU_06906 [Xanthomonas citri pv. malvacearum str. GSPB1386]|nr:hypothetical protein MOU_06906 [Xanthomonas citri pv. malvacearum str. GSPB1386]
MRSRPIPTRTERRGSDRNACAAVDAPRAPIFFNDSRSTPMWYFAWILGTGLGGIGRGAQRHVVRSTRARAWRTVSVK